MARIIIVLTDNEGVQEVRVCSASQSEERASRQFLDRVSPIISDLHEFVTNQKVAVPAA